MNILSGIPLHSLLDALPAQALSPVLAVSGQGIVLFLQAVAYVLVSLAAIAVLLRFGLRNGGHSRGGCGCHGKRKHQDEAAAESHCSSSAKSQTCCGGHDSQADAAHARTHEPQVNQTGGQVAGRATTHNGEARSLAFGRLPERSKLDSDEPAVPVGSAAAHIRAAVAPAAATQATPAAVTQTSAEEDAAEQRRITAVIAAAVHNVLGGQQHRIVRIQPISHGWAQEGRRDIFSSHRIR